MTNNPKTIDIFKFIKKYPYIKELKLQIYYILHPIAHIKKVKKEFKRILK